MLASPGGSVAVREAFADGALRPLTASESSGAGKPFVSPGQAYTSARPPSRQGEAAGKTH